VHTRLGFRKTFAFFPRRGHYNSVCISDLTPQKIGEENEVRRQHFEKFCKQIITDSCSVGARPLVLINSTNSARLWGWLSDRAIDVTNIDFKT
jgi:hypothetical protein